MIDLRNLTPKQQKFAAFLGSYGYSEEQITKELEKVEDEDEDE